MILTLSLSVNIHFSCISSPLPEPIKREYWHSTLSISNDRTVPMSHRTRGLRVGMDGWARQARAATGERRPPAGQNRRLGLRQWRGCGLREQTGKRAGTSKAGQTWQTDGPAGGWPKLEFCTGAGAGMSRGISRRIGIEI